jgi:hypothetical protein
MNNEALPNDENKPKNSAWAVAGLVVGIISVGWGLLLSGGSFFYSSHAAAIELAGLILFAVTLPSLLALIFSAVALTRIRKNNGVLLGKRKAIAGIVLGVSAVIIVPFIGVVAVIVNPYLYLLHCGGDGNETSAMGTLKQLLSTEMMWAQQDPDCNGRKDYWTFDISCLHRMYRLDNSTNVAFIPLDVARADMAPGLFTGSSNPFGEQPTIKSWWNNTNRIMTQPKSGYWFGAMLTDEDGKPYNQNYIGSSQIKGLNDRKYAFVAYPVKYGETGIRTFIVDETGTIYGWDSGSDKNKVILQWPKQDELNTKWEVAE